jgi:hypothetical protein
MDQMVFFRWKEEVFLLLYYLEWDRRQTY